MTISTPPKGKITYKNHIDAVLVMLDIITCTTNNGHYSKKGKESMLPITQRCVFYTCNFSCLQSHTHTSNPYTCPIVTSRQSYCIVKRLRNGSTQQYRPSKQFDSIKLRLATFLVPTRLPQRCPGINTASCIYHSSKWSANGTVDKHECLSNRIQRYLQDRRHREIEVTSKLEEKLFHKAGIEWNSLDPSTLFAFDGVPRVSHAFSDVSFV